jgi:hypothetical protein
MASEYSEPYRGVCEYATNLDLAKKLWEYTAELTGINIFNY